MRLRDRLPNYLTMSDISDMRQPPDYIIGIDGSYKYGIKTSNGQVISRNTDFYTVVMACHNDASTTTGALCFIKAGSYSLSAKLLFNRPFNLRGAGCNWDKGTKITLDANVNDNMIEYDGGGTNIYFANISDLTLNGNKANNASGSGIKLTLDVTDGVIQNVGLNSIKDYGMWVLTARSHITQCWIEFCGKYGLFLGGGDAVVSDCHIASNDLHNISGTASLLLSNCYIGTAVRCGLYYSGADNIINIVNCKFAGNSTGGAGNYSAVLFDSGTLLISNCSFNGTNHKYQVEFMANSHDGRVNNCYIGAFTTGDYLDGGTRNLIEAIGTEASNGEVPVDAAWPKGAIIQFTDTGDATGNGIYIKDRAGTIRKLT